MQKWHNWGSHWLGWIGWLFLTGAVAAQAATEADVTEFIHQLSSEDAGTRQAACERATEVGVAAIAPLGALVGGENRPVAKAARLALEMIVAHATRPGADEERAAANDALIGLIQEGQPAPTRQYAIRLLGDAGNEKAVAALAELLGDEEWRERARWALERIASPAAAQALLKAVEGAPGEFRAALIHSLGELGATEAVPTLLRMIVRDTDNTVRLAILEALGRIGDPRALPVFDAALNRVPEAVKPRILNPYLQLGEKLLAQGQTDQALPVFERALTEATTEQHRCAGLIGLGRLGRVESVPKMLPALADENPQVRATAAAGLTAMKGEGVGSALKEALPTAEPPVKGALLRVLAAREDPEMAALLKAATEDDSAEVRVTAFDLLGGVDDPALEATLLEAAERGSDLIQPVALGSYLRLAARREEKGETEAARAMYHQALRLASQDEQRRQALRGIWTIASPDSLPEVEPLLEVDGVRDEATGAAIAIAETLAENGETQRAKDLLHRILGLNPPRHLANAAAERLRDLGEDTSHFAREKGFVTHWWLTGPFPSENKAAWDQAFFPEQEIALEKEYEADGRKFQWHAFVTPDVQGVVNLEPQFDPRQNVAAYAYTEITVAEAQDVLFKIGSDDDVKVWLNGQLIHANPASRPLRVDEDVVATRLEAGVNRLLLKILQGGGQWEFCLRITGRDSRPLAFEERGAGPG